MKRTLISFLLVFLLSCGTTRGEHYRTRVLFRDSTVVDYTLLSVRSDAIVAEPYLSPDGMPQLIPLSGILQIYQEHPKSDMPILYGGLIGFGAAYGVAKLAGAVNHADYIGIGGVPFLFGGTGAIIGCAAREDQEKVCDPANTNDKAWLKQFSRYPENEPQELQKIQ